MKEYWIYVLKSLKDNNNYTGYTSNLEKRLAQHEAGRVKSTRNRRPLKLIYTEKFETSQETRKREKFLKTHIGRNELKNLTSGAMAKW